MKDLSDLFIFKSPELIEREWLKRFDKMERVATGNERLDAAAESMARNVFHAGWLACLTAIIESENRKDGIGG